MKRHTLLGRCLHITATLIVLPLLAGAKGGACSSDVPVGTDNEPGVCGPGACDGLEQTLEAKLCSDGSSVGRSVCAKKEDGTCFWDFPACPAGGGQSSCSLSECANLGVLTDVRLCPDGTYENRTICVRGSDQQCFWDFPPCPVDAGPSVDARAPGPCVQSDCAGLPVQDDAKLCPDGTGLGRTVCATRSDGTCFWDFPPCPAPLPTDASDCPRVALHDPGNPSTGCSLVGTWSLSSSHGSVSSSGVIEFKGDGSYYGGPVGTDLSQTYAYDGAYSVSGQEFKLIYSCGDGSCFGAGWFSMEFRNGCSVAILHESATECTGNRTVVAGDVVLTRP
jgi:hypothetical protein